MQSYYIQNNRVKLHYLDSGGNLEPLILMHGLTANAHAFDGLIAAGLDQMYRVISVDLRGRGKSTAFEDNYSLEAHAQDILQLLEHLEVKSVILGGHSFGGLLSLYLSIHYPEKIKCLLILDAAAEMHPNTREMLAPSLSRLGQIQVSFEDYLQKVKAAPYIDFWAEEMRSYYEADVESLKEGKVRAIPKLESMAQAVSAVLEEDWLSHLKAISLPTVLINATGEYSLGAALLPQELALQTVDLIPDCRYVEVSGNHQTMLYGDGAKEIVRAMDDFLRRLA